MEETDAKGRPVSIDAGAIETMEPGGPGRGVEPLTFVGLRSGRTLWIRSNYEPLRDRWHAALAAGSAGARLPDGQWHAAVIRDTAPVVEIS